MYACLDVSRHPHFWQNDRGLLRATAVTGDGTDTEQESAHTVDSGEENSPPGFFQLGRPAGRVSVCGKNLNFASFSDTINMINVQLCVMVVLIELYPFIPLSVTLIIFQGHVVAKSFN